MSDKTEWQNNCKASKNRVEFNRLRIQNNVDYVIIFLKKGNQKYEAC